MTPVAAYTPLLSLGVLVAVIAAPAAAAPPPCPYHASALCGAPEAGYPGGADNRSAEQDRWDELADSDGERIWGDEHPAAWEADFTIERHLDENAGWNRSFSSGADRLSAAAAAKQPERLAVDRSEQRIPRTGRDRTPTFRVGERLIAPRQLVLRDYAAHGLAPPRDGHYYVRVNETVFVVDAATQLIRAYYRLPQRRDVARRH